MRSAIFLLLILISASSRAGGIDKATSFALAKGATAGWTAECSIFARGIDSQGTYFVVVVFFDTSGNQTRTEVLLDKSNRIFREVSPGLHEVQAKLTGMEIRVEGAYFLPSVVNRDDLRCVAAIYPGTTAAVPPLHATNMRITVEGGEP